jgi:hypothetical protein
MQYRLCLIAIAWLAWLAPPAHAEDQLLSLSASGETPEEAYDRSYDAARLKTYVEGGACPIQNDTKGKYGAVYSVLSPASHNLPCGGAITLNNTHATIVPSPDRIALIRNGNIIVFRRTRNGVANFIKDDEYVVPKRLCNNKGETTLLVPDMNEQIIYFDNDAQFITLNANLAENYQSQQEQATYQFIEHVQDSNMRDLQKLGLIRAAIRKLARLENRFDAHDRIKINVSNGILEAPKEASFSCAVEQDWVTKEPMANSVEFTLSQASEACDHEVIELTTSQCLGSLQYVDMQTPALVHQPGVNATFMSMEGETRLLTATADSSYIMLQEGSTPAHPVSSRQIYFVRRRAYCA